MNNKDDELVNELNNMNEIEIYTRRCSVRRRVRKAREYIRGNNSCGAECAP